MAKLLPFLAKRLSRVWRMVLTQMRMKRLETVTDKVQLEKLKMVLVDFPIELINHLLVAKNVGLITKALQTTQAQVVACSRAHA